MKNEKRGNGKNKKIIIGVASIVAIAAVAVPTALTLANGNENAGASNTKKFSITICSGIDSIQDYNLTVSEGTKISELKSILKAIDGYKIEGIFRDEGMNHEFLDYETIKSYTKIFIKFVAVTYKVNIFDENRNFIETKEVSHNSGLFLDNPTKPADDFAEYEFTGWVNDMGKSVNITNIVSDLNIYPSFKSVMNEYKIGFVNSNNINNVLISVGGEPVTLETIYHYGATIKIKAVEMSGKKISEFKVIVGNYETINILSEEYKKEENGLDCYEIEFKGRGDVSIIYSEAASEYNIGQIPDGVTVYSENKKISSNDIVKHGEQLTIIYSVKEDYVLDKFEISGAVHISDNIYEVRSDINIIFECLYAYDYLNFEKVIDGYKVTGLSKEETKVVVIPNTYNGENVTEIADFAFKEKEITNLTIGENIKTIGKEAFKGCTKLAVINYNAIEASDMANFDIGEYYNSFMFVGNDISGTIVNIGKGVSKIAVGLFCSFDEDLLNSGRISNLSNIKSVNINDGVTKIGSGAFAFCVNLTQINIPSSIKEIDYVAFAYCMNLPSIELPEGLTSLGSDAFASCENLTTINIPSSISRLEDNLFNNCIGLSSINIPNSITHIGNYAFYECSGLKSVTIPSSVKTIEEYAFRYCSNIESVTIESADLFKKIQGDYNLGYVFYNAKQVRVPINIYSQFGSEYFGRYASTEERDYVIFDLTTSAPDHEYLNFSECEGGYEVSGFNDSVTEVVIPSFYKGKRVIGIKDGTLGTGVFHRSSITSLVIEEGVERIGDATFTECSSLISVILPNSLISFGQLAFMGSSLQYNIKDGACYLGNSENPYLVLYTASNHDSITNCIIDSNCKIIASFAFNNCTNLVSVEIPDSLQQIGSHAFYYCSSLTSVNLPSGLKTINAYLFNECTSLSSIVIPEGVTNIGVSAFTKCNFASINIPDSVISIGEFAFSHNKRLTSVTIPNSVKEIKISAFDQCYSLNTIIVESFEIYKIISQDNNIFSLSNVNTIKILKTVDDGSNTFLTQNYTQSEDGEYYVYTKNK